MSSARYERLATSPTEDEPVPPYASAASLDLGEEEANVGRRVHPAHRVAFIHDPRFDMPTPPKWQRVALLLTIAFLFWLAVHMRGGFIGGEGIAAIVE